MGEQILNLQTQAIDVYGIHRILSSAKFMAVLHMYNFVRDSDFSVTAAILDQYVTQLSYKKEKL